MSHSREFANFPQISIWVSFCAKIEDLSIFLKHPFFIWVSSCAKIRGFITWKSWLGYSPVAPHKSEWVTFSPLLRYILPRFPHTPLAKLKFILLELFLQTKTVNTEVHWSAFSVFKNIALIKKMGKGFQNQDFILSQCCLLCSMSQSAMRWVPEWYVLYARPLTVSFLIRASGKESHSQAGSATIC